MPPKEVKLAKESSKILSTPPLPVSGTDHAISPAAELARLQKAERERKELYDTAQANFQTIVEEAKQDNVKLYKSAKERIKEYAGDVATAVAKCRDSQERLDEAKKLLDDASEELEGVKKAFDLNTEVWWQAERTLVSLKKDEMAKLQMVQALLDWRESEVALRTHELNDLEKAKDVIEKPYEMAQADLWKTGEELKRLGVDLKELGLEENEEEVAEGQPQAQTQV